MRLVLILLLTAGLAAQEQKPVPESPPQQPIFRAGTDLVRVDVTVTANGDKPVADLTLEDFEVTDDGATREGVTTFGALGIGGLKMKIHKACIARLFEKNDLVLDAESIAELAESL